MTYGKYREQGFSVLAFPANDFMNQEPGSSAEIKQFCARKKVTFPVFEKISVKGSDQAPLYKWLTTHPQKEIAGKVVWNFQKYLVGRDGRVIAKFGPRTKADGKKLTAAIEKALATPRG